MQEDRMRCIISEIKKFELTAAETEFIAFVERNLTENGPIMKKMELILEGICLQKTKFIRDSIVSMLKREANGFHSASPDGEIRFS